MVRWADQAKTDLKAIYLFIARDSEYYAKKVVSELVDKAELLSDLPHLGRAIPELGDVSVREISAYSYRIIYAVTPPDDSVCVLAIVHKRRDFAPSEIGR
ncbi:MAG: type II toxin-antitoxin system RelE/ParE family toxin [Pseudomonadota bacterium]